jgi:predicted kinase
MSPENCLFASVVFLYVTRSFCSWLGRVAFTPEEGSAGMLVVLRGLPGSGKTTYIKDYLTRHQIKDYVICSANDYFNHGTKYKFNPRHLPAAHNECVCDTITAMANKTECVIVNNPNAQCWEYSHYKLLAKHFSYSVHVIEIDCPTEEHVEYFHQRCAYKIPREICLTMRNRWETDENVCLKSPHSPELDQESSSESESWSESDASLDSDDSDQEQENSAGKVKGVSKVEEDDEVDKCYPGDSLPYPKKTKQHLDDQLNYMVRRRRSFNHRLIRCRYV